MIKERIINDCITNVLITIGINEENLTEFDTLVVVTAITHKLDELKSVWLSNGKIDIWECVEIFKKERDNNYESNR